MYVGLCNVHHSRMKYVPIRALSRTKVNKENIYTLIRARISFFEIKTVYRKYVVSAYMYFEM